MNLFTYGTLMDPAVWERVAREECVRRAAVLEGYEARKLRGVTWPGLVEAPGVLTRGLLYIDVSAEAMARLDAWEGDGYERVAVSVQLEDGTAMAAEAYRVAPTHRFMVLDERWLPPA